jgi:hypothetical protein
VIAEEAIRCGDHPADALLHRLRGEGASSAADPAAGTDLVSFLERLDRRIPGERTVLAVVDERPAGAAPWLAGHPRWRMQRAPTHASWVGEVDAVLTRCLPCTAAERDRLRELLSADADFVWTGEG